MEHFFHSVFQVKNDKNIFIQKRFNTLIESYLSTDFATRNIYNSVEMQHML